MAPVVPGAPGVFVAAVVDVVVEEEEEEEEEEVVERKDSEPESNSISASCKRSSGWSTNPLAVE